MIPHTPRGKQGARLFGDILVSEGQISAPQLESALKAQSQDREKIKKFNLSTYLVENGIVDKKQLNEIEKKHKINQRLGDSLVADGVITAQELKSALDKKSDHQFLGEVLLKLKLIDKSQLYEYLKQQLSVPSFQTILIEEGLVSGSKLREIILENSLPRTIGEILALQGAITVQKLHRILKQHKKRRPIGEMMVDAGLISDEQLDLALEKQKFSDTPLGQTLVGEDIISDSDFYHVMARQYAMEYIEIDDARLKNLETNKLTRIISAKEALRYRAVPLSLEQKTLKLVLFDPNDIDRLDGFESIINFNVSLALVREKDFERVYQQVYGENPNWEEVEEDIGAMIEESLDLSVEKGDKREKDSVYVVADKDNEAEKLVNLIISYGIKAKASDVHIENDMAGIHIRYRIDGILRELKDASIRKRLQAKAAPIISRIKVMSDLDIAERRLPQDGSFRLSMFDKQTQSKVNLDFRVAICRGAFGENVVIRILDSRKANVRLDQLSHSLDMLNKFVNTLKNPSGMILVTGPTGSGKTSTLYAALHYLNHAGIKIITAEDPVEFKVTGLMQTQAETKIGLTFAKLLKSFLRCDPDIIMLGEIRDAETAEIAIEAALTGHLVLTSMHTNDAIGAISRLRDFGLSNLQIASALKGVIAQRLVRALCPACKRPYMPDYTEWNLIFPEEPVHLKFFRGEGCQECNNAGLTGRISISELLTMERGVVKAILDGADDNQIYEAAKKEGMKFMLDDGLAKLDKTTLAELGRVIPPDTIQRFRYEYGKLHDQFPGFELPAGSVLEYQMLITRSRQGFSKQRVHELFNNYRSLRKKLKQPTDHVNEPDFFRFINEKLENVGGSNGLVEYRVSLINKGKDVTIMVESSYQTERQQ